MPHSSSKSRADKQEEKSAEDEGDFPGSLSQNELNDEKEKAVTGVMDDLMAMVREACIQTQVIPFSAHWFKSYITEELERQLICLDEVEKLDEATGKEDEEPMPATLDAWAQGCVPVLKATHQHGPALHPVIEKIMDRVPATKNPKVDLPSDVLAPKIILPVQEEKERKDRSRKEPDTDDKFQRKKSFPPTKKDRKNIISAKEVPDKLLPPLSCSTKQTVNVGNKNMKRSTSSQMSKPSQSHKETLTLPKLHSSTKPRHLIYPQYEIVEDCDAKTSEKMQKGSSRKTK